MEPHCAQDRAHPGAGRASWLRRLGVAGFLFFLIKGLLWLLVPAFLIGRRWLGD